MTIPPALRAMNFENYRQAQENRDAYARARAFLAGEKSLYLYGNPGTGKTHLLAATLGEALRTYCPTEIMFSNVSRLLKIERAEYETREEAEERLIERISRKRLVFLDDISAENATGRTAEILYLILNDAIENGRPRLFITGNKPIRYISENVSDRIASRIVGLCGQENIVKVEGDDWRLNNG